MNTNDNNKLYKEKKWGDFAGKKLTAHEENNFGRPVENNVKTRRKIIRAAKKRGCHYCGEMEVCCLEFHHINQAEKLFNIGEASSIFKGVTLEALHKEIEKCEVVCANCHRKIHAGLIEVVK